MDFTDFMRNLKTLEMGRKARKDREPQKENDVALRTSSRYYKKKSVATPTTSKDEEELTLLIKNVNMYLKNKRSDLRRKEKKKAMKAITWDSDSESKDDSAHMCFMVQGVTPLR